MAGGARGRRGAARAFFGADTWFSPRRKANCVCGSAFPRPSACARRSAFLVVRDRFSPRSSRAGGS